jgi:hypothetical protein
VTLEREARTNLVYRNFTRVGADKMPDAKTMGRWGSALACGHASGHVEAADAKEAIEKAPESSNDTGGLLAVPHHDDRP